MEDCRTQNISCSEIKNNDGLFHFLFETPERTFEIEIDQNGAPLVSGPLRNLTYSSDVAHVDNKSVITHSCKNLFIKFLQDGEGGKISESCQVFNVKDDLKAEDSNWTPGPIAAAVIVLVIVTTSIAVGCYFWRRRRKGCGFPACVFGSTDTPDSQEQHSGDRAEEENRANIEQEQARLLQNGHSHSTRSNGDNMDFSINMDEINTTNDDKGAAQVKGALPQEDQNGNMWHDPGGGDTGWNCTRNCPNVNGGELGEQSSSHDKDKGQHLPQSQGSAGAGFDQSSAGVGQELVNGSGPYSKDNTLSDDDKEVTTEHLR